MAALLHLQLVSTFTSRSKCKTHALSLACSARTTSLRSCSSFVGFRSTNESSLSTPCWFSRRCTVCCRRISWMTVSCSPILGAVNSDRLTLRLCDRCFAVAGPRTWNSLLIKLRQPELSLEQFTLHYIYMFSARPTTARTGPDRPGNTSVDDNAKN